MKLNLFNTAVKLNQLNERHAKVALALITLTLFVIGAGAPAADGGL